MRKVIEDIILGRQKGKRPQLRLPDEPLQMQMIEGESCRGSFFLESCDEQKVRGIVTSSCPYLTFKGEQFDAACAEITYEYQNENLLEGQTDQGEIVVTSTAGEYLLAFQVTVTRVYLSSSIGKIKTLNDFTNLAKLNWEEALKIFQSPHFLNIFHEKRAYTKLLYDALTSRSASSHEMEEFLIALEKKKRNHFYADQDVYTCQVGKDTVSDNITLTKSEWGFLELKAQCDAPFIQLERACVGMYDFIGKHAEVAFHILPEAMHAGKNYAKILLDGGYETQEVTLIVTLEKESPFDPTKKRQKQMDYFLIRNYVAFRLGKTEKKEWVEKSAALLREMEREEKVNPWVYLLLSWLMWENQEVQNSQRMRELYLKNPKGPRSPEHAFYLYLESEASEDAAYRRELTVKVREIFMRYQNHPVLAWVLLQMDEALKRNPERKYHMVKKFSTDYSISPVFYCEAADLLKKHPEFLHKQDVFEMRLLYWMAKNHLLTEEIALRVLEFSRTRKQFDRRFFFVLTRCHKILNCDQSMKSLCAYLIKQNCFGTEYFSWFSLGVKRHLKIAGLYEAYMMSWSKADGEIPREILKYFSMSKSLPAKRKAMLFSYVVRNRERMGKDWEPYMVMVRNFARTQLEAGAMNEDLAIIYEEVKKQVSKEEWNSWQKNAESVYRLFVPETALRNVQVFQAGNLPVQRVATQEGSAYISLKEKPFVILYEDRQGHLYEAKDTFRLKKMISGPHIYEKQAAESSADKEPIPEKSGDSLEQELDRCAGSTKEMYGKIYEAQKMGLDTHHAARHLLARMLFTGSFCGDHEALFEMLGKEQEDLLIRNAYVSYFARSYALEQKAMPLAAARVLADEILGAQKVNVYCELAFLKHWCEDPQENTKEAAEELLKNYLLSGCYFSCYQKLPLEMQRKFFLYDQLIFEFHAPAGGSYQCCWTDENQSGCVDLTECMPGIYSTTFSSPPDHSLSVSVVDADGNTVESRELQKPPCPPPLKDSRYGWCATKSQREVADEDRRIEELFQRIEE